MIGAVFRWLLRVTSVVAKLVVILFLLMIICWPLLGRYRVACGTWLDKRIDAPLRASYIELLEHFLNQEGMFYLRIDNRIFLPSLGDFDPQNWEWRFAFSIASGDTLLGTRTPPPAIDRLVTAWEAETGQKLERSRWGAVSYPEFHKLDQCAVKRAALTLADGE